MSSPSGDVCELYTASDLVSCLTAKRQVSVAMTIRPLPYVSFTWRSACSHRAGERSCPWSPLFIGHIAAAKQCSARRAEK